ncbi:MAG: VOC family protein [Bryobacteraceae bacterium]|nr:VOC family protein [Bryobacteraceae bacterium]
MRKLAAAFLLCAGVALAQLPDFYKTVDRLIWVVEDMDATLEGLKKLGFTNLRDSGEVELTYSVYRAKPAEGTMRFASGRFADVAVHWIQPTGGANAFEDFLKTHKSGVFSLVHRAPSKEAYEQELARLKDLGVGVLQSGFLETDAGNIHYAFLNTAPEGKYILGLIHFPSTDEGPLAIAPDNPSSLRVSQYAFAVKELEPVSKFWAKLGFPEMTYTQGKLSDLRYKGEPGQFEMRLGWQRHGQVPYEWIQSLQGPDTYRDHMAKHGEGFHHLGINVESMDEEVARWASLGFPEVQSGGWGDKGQPGSGRFTYVDAQSLGGVDIELLWSLRQKPGQPIRPTRRR